MWRLRSKAGTLKARPQGRQPSWVFCPPTEGSGKPDEVFVYLVDENLVKL